MKYPSLKMESSERIKRFQELLGKEQVDGALIIQKMAVFYLIGTDQNGVLWVPAGGEPLFMVRKSYERSLQDALIERILPLKSLSKVPELVREHNGKTSGRIGIELDVLPARMYLAFVGHGLGLEVDEWPVIGKNSDHVLQDGMVVALEPKVVFPGEGVVGIENTFLITEKGMEKLSRFPDDIVVI